MDSDDLGTLVHNISTRGSLLTNSSNAQYLDGPRFRLRVFSTAREDAREGRGVGGEYSILLETTQEYSVLLKTAL